jgi:hypothetical protein
MEKREEKRIEEQNELDEREFTHHSPLPYNKTPLTNSISPQTYLTINKTPPLHFLTPSLTVSHHKHTLPIAAAKQPTEIPDGST